MQFKDFLKFGKRIKELPQYTPKEDLPRAIKEMKEKNIKEFFGRKDKPAKMDRFDRDDKIVRDMERAGHRKDKRELGGWLKAFANEDAKEMRRFEREMARD